MGRIQFRDKSSFLIRIPYIRNGGYCESKKKVKVLEFRCIGNGPKKTKENVGENEMWRFVLELFNAFLTCSLCNATFNFTLLLLTYHRQTNVSLIWVLEKMVRIYVNSVPFFQFLVGFRFCSIRVNVIILCQNQIKFW